MCGTTSGRCGRSSRWCFISFGRCGASTFDFEKTRSKLLKWSDARGERPGVVGGGTPIRGEDGGMPIGGGAAASTDARDKYMIKTGCRTRWSTDRIA